MSPAHIVQQQLDAYNAKDLERLLLCYAPDAQQYTLHGELLAQGRDTMRARFALRFEEPDLQARLLSRNIVGNVVVDQEIVTRNFPEGKGSIEMLCIYEIANNLIQKASFVLGEKVLFSLKRKSHQYKLKWMSALHFSYTD